ncbi:isochorismate synthase [Alicyclobacillus suci]|uniref:isochorismate synthase n=1 Tax=Alicyclobacillus suci TaxID=2816080 RepID=UPI001A8FD491|nr:isochorismate synthase [Alicyclobacillus suci]
MKRMAWDDMVGKLAHAYADDAAVVWEDKRIVRVKIPLEIPLHTFVRWQIGVPAVFSSDPKTHRTALGLGAATQLTGNGPDALGDIQMAIRAKRVPRIPVTWFGGFVFDSTQPVEGTLSGWPHALWFVPTVTLERHDSERMVTVTAVLPNGLSTAAVNEALKPIGEVLSGAADNGRAAFHSGAGTNDLMSPEVNQGSVGIVHDARSWEALIQKAVGELRRGEMAKVVLARQTPVTIGASLSEALARLLDTYATSHVFALAWDGRWLLAASPEQLVRVEGGWMAVDCLAGTTARGDTPEIDQALADALLNSAKNREEHAAVVRVVTDRLRLVAEEMTVPDAPVLKKLANVQHLYTPVRAKLRAGKHLFDAASLLHPTPAVGGVPLGRALAFIRAHEGWPRGYYAGAIGYVDAGGNGLLSVALRSAAVAYPQAVLYAGCGIVAASNPADEWQETEMKLTPMRLALG